MSFKPDPDNIIRAIRESFGASVAVYSMGCCYGFYKILKEIFHDAEAYYDGNHVWTKIGDSYYDIRGKLQKEVTLHPMNEEMVKKLSSNIFTDEKRNDLKKERISCKSRLSSGLP